MSKVLLTGYEPFDGFVTNPSEEAVKALKGKTIGNHQIDGIILPLDYSKADEMVKDFIKVEKPSYVICCGQANRPIITLEYVGINVLNTSRPDNYGNTPDSNLIDPEAPAAYFSTLDVHEIAKCLAKIGIPSEVSYHAGTYGCNWILFKLLHWIATERMDVKVAFVHLPPLPKQVFEKESRYLATMSLDMQLDALKTIIKSLE